MNKILKSLLTLVLLLSVGTSVNAETDGDGSVEGNGSSTTYVATVNDQNYETVQAAIDANNQATINVVANTTEDITVPSGKIITLVIAEGVTITNSTSHTITNNGTLTVTGAGNVDNVTHKKAALVNNVGATASLSGSVKYTRSQEAGSDKNNSGGNSYYNIKNTGNMRITENTTVTSSGHFSSLIINGDVTTESTLVIENGTFSGGINTVKNGDYGRLTIENGTFSNTTQSTILNWHYALIKGGTFTAGDNASNSLIVGKWKEYTKHDSNSYVEPLLYTTLGETYVTGGNFTGGVSQYTSSNSIGQWENGSYFISGGTYSVDVSEYLVEGYNLAKIGDKYVVVKDGENAPVKEAITPAVDETTFDEVSNVIAEATTAVTVTGVKLEANQLEKVADEEKTKVDEAVKSAVNKSNEVEILLPLNINLKAITKNTATGDVTETGITQLNNKITAIIYLDETTLATLQDKTIKVVREHDGTYDVLDATLDANALKFETDKFSNYYVVTYKVSTLDDTKKDNTSTNTTTKSTTTTTKSTGGWDDGGPFTTDNCGNVFDRWGNKIYEAKGCNVGGYNLVRTSVED